MSRHLMTYGLSFLSLLGTTAGLFAQAAATPPAPPAKDREPHAVSRPQETTPRVKKPNTDALGNKALPPSPSNPVLDPEDLQATREAAEEDAKPSEIRSTITTPNRKALMNTLQVDTMLATYAALGDHVEMVLADIAGERAQSSAVKDFAAMVAHDHSEFLLRLKKFAPDATKPNYLNVPLPPARREEVASRIAAPTRILPTTGIDDTKPAPKTSAEERAEAAALELPVKPIPSGSTGRAVHLLNIEREVATLSLAASKEMLELKRGLDFDKCYIGQQIGLHMAMKSKLAVYQHHVSPELAAIFAEGETMTDQHLMKARDLMKTLETGTPALGLTPAKRSSRNGETQAQE